MASDDERDPNFGLGAEARGLLVRSIDDLLSKRLPDRHQGPQGSRTGELDKDLNALGLAALAVPSTAGGFDAAPVDLAAVAEALGRGLARLPNWPADVALGTLLASAGADWPVADLDQALQGRGPVLVDGSALCATRRGEGWTLSGAIAVGPSRDGAGALVAVVGTGADALLVRIGTQRPGLTETACGLIDGSPGCAFTFASVPVGPEDRLAHGAHLHYASEKAADLARLLICAEALGCMSALIDQTASFVGVRQQFGGPIGRFQVLQHRLADLWMARQLSAALVRGALEALAGPAPERSAAVLAAQAFVAQSGREVVEGAIQLHGAMGLTDALPLGLYAKRVLVLTGQPAFGRDHAMRRAALVDAMVDAAA